MFFEIFFLLLASSFSFLSDPIQSDSCARAHKNTTAVPIRSALLAPRVSSCPPPPYPLSYDAIVVRRVCRTVSARPFVSSANNDMEEKMASAVRHQG